MKYSLRSLMIFITLVCVVLGARIGYLRAMAQYHLAEFERLDRKFKNGGLDPDEFEAWNRSDLLRNAYQQAVYRPWTTVKEAP